VQALNDVDEAGIEAVEPLGGQGPKQFSRDREEWICSDMATLVRQIS
jgi:hypothetical protein